ncbi:scarecrow-like protein 21 [Amaranthus tricolor]|uniref:scarecrow-like protein 21 n=1 Tax=Amaranthus tricolor TaxID=29722 RepID=UPI002585C50B|nr:scarecrow-like protein 21 [Amaranthus tricolor]XP_057537395.1 scarecrow-like protein 21 [Amaranthus tricolor]
MQTSQRNCIPSAVHGFHYQHAPEMTPYCSSHYQIMDKNTYPDIPTQESLMSFQTYDEGYFTLDSAPATSLYHIYDSPSDVSTLSNRSSFSPQGSQSYISDPHQSSDNNYGSPISGSSVVDDNTELRNRLRDLDRFLMEPDSPQMSDGHFCSMNSQGYHVASSNRLMEMLPKMELQQVLYLCAQAISDNDLSSAETLMNALGNMVSINGTPIQRLGAYMLEGLRARIESSGYTIYKKLRCDQPTSKELLTYMHTLYQVCPYFKFAYVSSNSIIQEAIGNDRSIHIIDFQIGMGTQWTSLLHSLANRPGGPPLVRITGVDDSQSAYARGGGLDLVEKKLSAEARSFRVPVPFEFNAAAMSGCQVNEENLRVRPGEALFVNFPFMLHHMPDESVSTENHRDRLLRLIKSLSPRVVTVVEQESNTNTPPFLQRFLETLDYYTAMFESVDVALPRDDKKRINTEMHCLARDIVNMIACEDSERVERHELFGKWRARLSMAGFTQLPLSFSVKESVKGLMKEFHENYRLAERDGTLYLGWKTRGLSSASAWR